MRHITDVSIGCYDGAEICRLIRILILSKLTVDKRY